MTAAGAPFPDGFAFVVGGSGGLGSAICRALAASGTNVAVGFRHGSSQAEAVCAEIAVLQQRSCAIALDVCDSESIEAAIVAGCDALGALHTVVFAAGADIGQPNLVDVDPADLKDAFDLEAHGFLRVAQAALPHLRQVGGSVVLLSSAGLTRYPKGDALSVSPKAAAEQLMRAIAREEGRHGVRANAVRVGVVEAGIFERLRGGVIDAQWETIAKRRIALGRFASAEEIAAAVVFLASNHARYITGQALGVDGGYGV